MSLRSLGLYMLNIISSNVPPFYHAWPKQSKMGVCVYHQACIYHLPNDINENVDTWFNQSS